MPLSYIHTCTVFHQNAQIWVSLPESKNQYICENKIDEISIVLHSFEVIVQRKMSKLKQNHKFVLIYIFTGQIDIKNRGFILCVTPQEGTLMKPFFVLLKREQKKALWVQNFYNLVITNDRTLRTFMQKLESWIIRKPIVLIRIFIWNLSKTKQKCKFENHLLHSPENKCQRKFWLKNLKWWVDDQIKTIWLLDIGSLWLTYKYNAFLSALLLPTPSRFTSTCARHFFMR